MKELKKEEERKEGVKKMKNYVYKKMKKKKQEKMKKERKRG